jgi:hypothetical protein
MIINYASTEVNILVNGKSVAKYHKDGKVYIEAKEGSEYEIEVKNNGFARILAVASVDGLNVLTGEQASVDDAGYVVNSYTSCKIKGFRYSDDGVAAFTFTPKQNSYAASKDDNSVINCGVIGVIVYDEYDSATWTITSAGTTVNPLEDYGFYKGIPDKNSTTVTCLNADVNSEIKAMSSLRSVSSFDMGSGWGKSKESKVTSTKFIRGDVSKTFEIYYASRESLINMGVIQPKLNQVAFPKSFPKYATPPKGWTA